MRFTIGFTILFLYVIVAVVFWGYSLQQRSDELLALELKTIELQKNNLPHSEVESLIEKANKKRSSRYKQYWGEGATIVAIALLAAAFIYIAYFKQLKLAQLQRNFMMSITHELKTPLAGILLNIQTLLRRNVNDEIKNKLLNSSEWETKRLNELCNNILVATQLETGSKALRDGNCILNEVMDAAADIFLSHHPNRKLEIETAEDKCAVRGDENMWLLILSNLLENAHKYSPENEPIELILIKQERKFLLQIKDKGEGIKAEDRKKIFDKFYRIGNENTRKSKGTGIGLYLVKKLLAAFKYDINVRFNEPKDSIFEVELK